MAELKEPGVEVEQKFTTQSATIVTPTLLPCVIGVGKQLVNVLRASASGGSEINSQAKVLLPAQLLAETAAGSPPAYSGLNAQPLVLSVNNGPDVTITFVGTTLSPASVAAQIREAFLAAEITEATAEEVGDDGFRIVTYSATEFDVLEVRPGTSVAVAAAFGFVVGYTAQGATAYGRTRVVVTESEFPDPRGNLAELTFEPETLRLFLALGGGTNLRELSRTESLLSKGGGGGSASIEGTVSLGTSGLYGGGGTLNGKKLNIVLDDATAVVVTFASPADATALKHQINAALGQRSASTGGGGGLALTSRLKGTGSKVAVVDDATPANDAKALLGFTSSNSSSVGVAGVFVKDDGNGDALSPLVKITGLDFTLSPSVAQCTGLVDLSGLSYPGDLSGKTLTLRGNGRGDQTYTFPNTVAATNPNDPATLLDAFFAAVGLNASVSTNFLRLETDPTYPLGEEAVIEVVGGTAVGVLGLVPQLVGTQDLTAVAADLTVLNTKKFKISLGLTAVEHTFSGLTNVSAPADVATALNGNTSFAAIAVASIVSNTLRIRGKNGGKDAPLTVLAASSNDAAVYLGFSVGQSALFHRFVGTPYKPVSGDDLYVDGVLVGRITQVGVGGDAAVLKVNKQLTITANLGAKFTIRAKGLQAASSTRPTPELLVDGSGALIVKHDLLRDTNGEVISSAAPFYMAYRAVRRDVTGSSKNAALLRFSSTEDVEALIGPISPQNPLALGAYMALINAPGSTISVLGVDEVSADAPDGTPAGFIRALEFLESQNVYALAPLTHDETVIGATLAHVVAMSAPEQKAERIAFVNLSTPTKRLDGLVASGEGNGVGSANTQFDTSVAGLSQLVLAADVNPAGVIPAAAGLFLDIARDGKRYSIASVTGSVVTIRTSFSAGENDDGYYATSVLPSSLIGEVFSVKVRGLSLTRPDGSLDKDGVAETVAAQSAVYGERRLTTIFPDKAVVSIGGVETVVEGYYQCAVRAGMRAKYSPSQSFTNFPQIGLLRVLGSQDTFSRKQLNVIAGGGVDINTQVVQGAPVTSRFAISTDLSSVEKRTDSITAAIDYTAIFLRLALRAYIGKYNITNGFIDGLGNVATSVLIYLVTTGVISSASLVSITQDADNPDTLLITISVVPLYPCNAIKVTIEV